MDIEQMKKLEEFYNKSGLSVNKFREHFNQFPDAQREHHRGGYGGVNNHNHKGENINSTKTMLQTSSYSQHVSSK